MDRIHAGIEPGGVFGGRNFFASVFVSAVNQTGSGGEGAKSGGGAVMKYYFSAFGAGISDAMVPLRITYSLLAALEFPDVPGRIPWDYAGAAFQIRNPDGRDVFNDVIEFDKKGREYREVKEMRFDIPAGEVWSVVMAASAKVATGYALAKVDPLITIDSDFLLSHPGYSVAVSPGIYNGVSAIPEPKTYALMLIGLGLIGFVAVRKSTTLRTL